MKQTYSSRFIWIFTALALALQTPASADNIRITIESTAPVMGVSTTPYWIGFHDGSFDLYTEGSPASEAIERMAEDGNAAPLRSWFNTSMPTGKDLVLTGRDNPNGPPLFFPQTGNQTWINLDPKNPAHRYLSFFSMILPSNDAFIGNDDPMAMQMYDDNGNFVGGTWMVTGNWVMDAGTEVNDEVASNVPMLGQTVANSGSAENGVVMNHAGFMPSGPIISKFPNANFNSDTYMIARIIVEKIPVNHTSLEIEIQNLAPAQGTLITPFWIALHNGEFDLFDMGMAANEPLEHMAEDGNAAPLVDWFNAAAPFGWNNVATGPANPGGPPLFFQGQSNSYFLNVDANNPSHAYFSYLAMVLPSNDAFVANENPMSIPVFQSGQFVSSEITIKGSDILDAGTEVNDEAAQNVPVLGQMTANTGTTEGGMVMKHSGFVSGGAVLAQFPMADFTQADYSVAKIKIIKRFNPWMGIPLNPKSMRDSPTFGIVDDNNFPWVTHKHHGTLYFPRGGSMQGFWAYNSQGDLGWIFTSAAYYPKIYRQSDATWYEYQRTTSNPRIFEIIATGEMISFE